MRHIIISFIFILTTLSSFGQFDILWDDDPGVTYNGQTINIVKDYAGFDVYMHCQNNSGAAVDVNFRRVVLSNNDSIFNDQFCDNNFCYACFGNDWTTPAINSLQDGDSSLMKPTFYFSAGGNVLIRYYIIDVNDNPIDSVDVNIVNTVSVNELNQKLISTYPVPVKSHLNIDFPSNFSDPFEVNIYDLNGKLVFNRQLINLKNTIDLNNLKSGYYTYNITNNTSILKKDKLIINH
tara:strand:+ start:1483 stop:2190 length:708 start_codon:yes stop_codon:yes gene_type:complete